MTAQADSGLEALVVQPAALRPIDRLLGLGRRVLADKRVKFVLTGALNTAFGFGCFVAYQYLVGVRFGYMWTLVLSHITTVLFAFVTHRRLVFQVSGSVMRDLWRFESVYLVALGINAVLLPLAVELAGLPVLVAQAGITALNAFVSWMGHSRFSFHRKAVAA
ncbi:GtrA family protein [Terracoccus sp. 273MFTsu3.1]|uniref:GtrA family protein n=1 Tax=Terracoccus sp. 273MFTsu3.1 TaxID=1172188 RepID=UPI000372F1C8|nr:GtrA family protein [Terracoccus sp. 273MFTsu3.1]